jgi:O-antigen/teichoic acid export membrane protein
LFNSERIASRFLFSISFNIIRGVFSFLAGLYIAKGLGPVEYGNFTFLLGSFIAIRQLIDLGTSSAFFTFISQKKQSKLFYLIYFGWQLVQLIIVIIIIYTVFPQSWISHIWQGQNNYRILIAFFASFMMNNLWFTTTSIAESIRKSIMIQFINMAIMIIHFIIIYYLLNFSSISVDIIFYLISGEYIIAILISAYILNSKIQFEKSKIISLNDIIHEYFKYCAPLIVLAFISFGYHFSDRWFLQKFSGSMEQGLYAISAKFSMVSLVATASIINIYWKEIAESFEDRNFTKIKYLYKSTTRGLFFIGVFIACLVIPWSKEIIFVMLGEKYLGASIPLTIMFFYPIHQSLGQINGSTFMATGMTKESVIIGNIFLAISIPIVYLLIAPPHYKIPGFDLGAIGVAYKMVGLQLIAVNVQSYYLSYKFKFKFDWIYQPVNIIVFLLFSYFLKLYLPSIINGISEEYYRIFLSFSVVSFYSLFSILYVYLFPSMVGQTRATLKSYINIFK